MPSETWPIPTFADVLAARRRIAPHLRPTPLHAYPQLGEPLGAEVRVKHENHQPTGAFKIRGGLNLVSQLSDDERARGLIAASTGNHGQSVAFAARRFGVSARICVPEHANPVKVAAMRQLGAELIEEGAGFDDARENAERLADEAGYRYVHSGNEPHLIAGVGTETLEIFEDFPEVEVVIVPRRRGERRRRRLHRRQGRQPGGRGDRRAVRGVARRVPVVEGGPQRGGAGPDLRRGPLDRHAVRAARRRSSMTTSTTSSSSATTRSARRSAR